MQPEAALSELSQIDAAPAAPGAPGAASSGADYRAFLVGSAGITWACKHCDTMNSIDTDECSSCGMPLADLLRAPAESRPRRDPNTVALISMIWPGAGHGYLGEWGQAIARAVVSLLVLVVAGLSYAQTGLGPMTAAFSGVSFVFWAVTAHDSFQEATNAPSRAVLKGRSLLWLVMGILMLLMGMLVIEGLQVNAAVR